MALDSIFDQNRKYEKRFLLRLLEKARKDYPDSISFIDDLISKLQNNSTYRLIFREELQKTFGKINIVSYLVDSGIHLEDNLFSIFRKKIMDSLLPDIEDNNELTSVVNEIFYNSKNLQAIRIIPRDRWKKLFEVLYQDVEIENFKGNTNNIQNQLLQAISILTVRITGGFSDKEMMRYSNEVNYLNNPFSKLSMQISNIIESPQAGFDMLEIKESISKCKHLLNDILTQKDYKGISLKVASKINRLQQQLARLQIILNSFNELKLHGLISFYSFATKKWVEFYAPKNFMSNQLSSTVYLITFLVTYHNGKTGEKYITQTAKEYNKMFWTACGGGLIVSFLCFIKTGIGNIPDTSPLFKAFFFSINYAVGFCTIYLTHMTLATKQPSMTAARLARALVPTSGSELNVKDFTTLFAQLVRSQMIAFLGNVVAGFVVSLGIFYLLNQILGFEVIKYSKAYHYWEEVVIMDWHIFYFGAIAGVFLFLSGLISGMTINSQRFHNIPERIYNHPILKKSFSERRRRRISNWFEKNLGGVVGNVAFGFMMGCAFLIGDFTGQPFDIRHITFVSGNFAIGIGGMGYHFDIGPMIIGFIAIFMVGWCNFLVSFTFSLLMAMRSNNIPFYKIFTMIAHTIKAFIRNPLPFFVPPLWTKRKEEV
ncbi:site-specific recombinase [Empedobacter stercoris]|uniref:Site-specific recombinase n=2 Tax=Empedobacter TaxID=59734 RepID=A0ABY8V5K6_9FLAO|nr:MULTISPECIES: site-specific recombinase Gcr [Empedobacter]MCA4777270.1 site-specific recombinase Gcr [Empedobacter stercoris]MCA4810149.1 site-specific recombinase Gcr [Empedobacter stercoris]MDM1523428.1 site-specific recombinase Gcr [Empedobacter sp. 225-1]MDM1543456.1 site-specific recombinase Gcr [Empedobacter sp. 189-2]NOJ74536.1 site-specific recombinase Gcr [Empedobacter stercoris]